MFRMEAFSTVYGVSAEKRIFAECMVAWQDAGRTECSRARPAGTEKSVPVTGFPPENPRTARPAAQCLHGAGENAREKEQVFFRKELLNSGFLRTAGTLKDRGRWLWLIYFFCLNLKS